MEESHKIIVYQGRKTLKLKKNTIMIVTNVED